MVGHEIKKQSASAEAQWIYSHYFSALIKKLCAKIQSTMTGILCSEQDRVQQGRIKFCVNAVRF